MINRGVEDAVQLPEAKITRKQLENGDPVCRRGRSSVTRLNFVARACDLMAPSVRGLVAVEGLAKAEGRGIRGR